MKLFYDRFSDKIKKRMEFEVFGWALLITASSFGLWFLDKILIIATGYTIDIYVYMFFMFSSIAILISLFLPIRRIISRKRKGRII